MAGSVVQKPGLTPGSKEVSQQFDYKLGLIT